MRISAAAALILGLSLAPRVLAQQPPNLAAASSKTIEVNPSVFQDILPAGSDVSSYVMNAASLWADDAILVASCSRTPPGDEPQSGRAQRLSPRVDPALRTWIRRPVVGLCSAIDYASLVSTFDECATW